MPFTTRPEGFSFGVIQTLMLMGGLAGNLGGPRDPIVFSWRECHDTQRACLGQRLVVR